MQIVYQALLHQLFGLHPLGYHLVNASVLCAMTILLYWALRELGFSRIPSLATATVYGLMPNYSTDRFWFAAFGYTLSMAFFFLSFYSDLRAVRSESATLWIWKSAALCALICACLGYEIVFPLFVASMPIVWLRARKRWEGGLVGRLRIPGTVVYVGMHYAAVGGIAAYKVARATGLGTSESYAKHLMGLLFGSVATNFGTFILGLPEEVWMSLRRLSPATLSVALAVGLMIFGHLARVIGGSDHSLPPRAFWIRFGLIGLSVFLLGYSIFVFTGRVGFGSTGIYNRLSIVAALGVAAAVVAAIGWVSRLRPVASSGRWVFSSAIALFCMSGFLITSLLASDWAVAYAREQRVLASIQTALPRLPPRTTVILHGLCPYVGPAIVFESDWDLTGALKVKYRDPTLRADVTTAPTFLVEPNGIRTSVYGGADSTLHLYGRSLLLFDERSTTVTPLVGAAVAHQYFRRNPAGACPPGGPGVGAVIFPMDRLFLKMQGRLGLEGA